MTTYTYFLFTNYSPLYPPLYFIRAFPVLEPESGFFHHPQTCFCLTWFQILTHMSWLDLATCASPPDRYLYLDLIFLVNGTPKTVDTRGFAGKLVRDRDICIQGVSPSNDISLIKGRGIKWLCNPPDESVMRPAWPLGAWIKYIGNTPLAELKGANFRKSSLIR